MRFDARSIPTLASSGTERLPTEWSGRSPSACSQGGSSSLLSNPIRNIRDDHPGVGREAAAGPRWEPPVGTTIIPDDPTGGFVIMR